jgi:hypothetical protein
VKLDRLLPSREATELLAAILLDGPPAIEAWTRWLAAAGDTMQALGADAILARPLLPLLYDSVRRNGLTVDRETATYLRSAFLTESLRGRTYHAIVDELVAVLRKADVPFLLIKGAATGPLYYPDPALRHAHDIEILVGDRARVHAALAGSPFRPTTRHDFVHPSGLPLRVHTRLVNPPLERQLWTHAIPLPNGAPTLDPTHTLALTLVHASRSVARHSARWVCDAHAIIRTGNVDWTRFTTTITAARAAIPAAAQLRWLRDSLNVLVPAEVLQALDERAARAGLRERALVLRGINVDRISLWRRVMRFGVR